MHFKNNQLYVSVTTEHDGVRHSARWPEGKYNSLIFLLQQTPVTDMHLYRATHDRLVESYYSSSKNLNIAFVYISRWNPSTAFSCLLYYCCLFSVWRRGRWGLFWSVSPQVCWSMCFTGREALMASDRRAEVDRKLLDDLQSCRAAELLRCLSLTWSPSWFHTETCAVRQGQLWLLPVTRLSRHRRSLEMTNKPATKANTANMTSWCCMRSHKPNF